MVNFSSFSARFEKSLINSLNYYDSELLEQPRLRNSHEIFLVHSKQHCSLLRPASSVRGWQKWTKWCQFLYVKDFFLLFFGLDDGTSEAIRACDYIHDEGQDLAAQTQVRRTRLRSSGPIAAVEQHSHTSLSVQDSVGGSNCLKISSLLATLSLSAMRFSSSYFITGNHSGSLRTSRGTSFASLWRAVDARTHLV